MITRSHLITFFFTITFFSAAAMSAVDCPEKYPSGNTFTYSDGTMRFPDGNTLRYSDGTMRFPNGNTFRYSDGTLRFQNGNTLRSTDGTMRYENGNTLRSSDGTLRDPNGNTNQSGSVSFNADFGKSQMRVTVRPKSATFQTTIAFGEGIVILDMNEQGNLSCTVEGANPSSDFRVEGNQGSAYVTVKPGKDVNSIKKSIQAIMDGN